MVSKLERFWGFVAAVAVALILGSAVSGTIHHLFHSLAR